VFVFLRIVSAPFLALLRLLRASANRHPMVLSVTSDCAEPRI
jgi:hypothetical protein